MIVNLLPLGAVVTVECGPDQIKATVCAVQLSGDARRFKIIYNLSWWADESSREAWIEDGRIDSDAPRSWTLEL